MSPHKAGKMGFDIVIRRSDNNLDTRQAFVTIIGTRSFTFTFLEL